MRSRSIAVASVLFICLMFALAGCQKKAVVQPDAGTQGQPPAASKDQDKVVDKKLDGKIESVDSKDKGPQYVESKESMFSDILFDYDRYDVKDTYRQTIQAVSALMTKNITARLSIEGHCDERGTNEYNLALGDRRAKAVKDALIAAGIASARIDVLSYGEEKPVCKDQTEDCWAKNRRAHFVVLTKAGK